MSSDEWEGVKEAFKENAELKRLMNEDKRIQYAMKFLLDRGWILADRNDGHSFVVQSPIGRRFHFWPYTGWYNRLGKKEAGANPRMWQGRGIKNLVHAGTFE